MANGWKVSNGMQMVVTGYVSNREGGVCTLYQCLEKLSSTIGGKGVLDMFKDTLLLLDCIATVGKSTSIWILQCGVYIPSCRDCF